MKKLLFSIQLLLLLSTSCFGQYDSLVVENAHWIIEIDYTLTTDPHDDTYFGYTIEGDTLINGIDYKKIYLDDYDIIDAWSYNYAFENRSIFGAIREDVQNKKVYGIFFCPVPGIHFHVNTNTCNCNTDTLIFDFSLAANDTMQNNCLNGGNEIIITQTTNEYTFGKNRNVLYMFGWDRLIEGIGSAMGGLFSPFTAQFLNSHPWLQKHCIGSYEDCGIQFMNHIEINALDFSIYPNPASNEIKIKLPTAAKDATLNIFSNTGQLAISEKLSALEKTIDISSLGTGVYFIRINHEKSSFRAQKLIVKQ